MIAIRRARSTSIVACLLAAVALVGSAGCGFCVVEFTCPEGNCCREFRCYEVKDCPAMLAKTSNPNALAQAEQCDEEHDPSLE